MTTKLMAIRRPDTCAGCAASLPPKTHAWWDSDDRTITCVSCRPQAATASPEPQSTTAWAKGADGERRLAAHLDRDLGSVATVLHDRRVPKTRGNIDHLVVAPSGIWIVDAKNYSGRVEQRTGRDSTPDQRLFVAGRDRTNLVESMGWQLQAVHHVTDLIGFGAVPIGRCLCFTNAQWPLYAEPFTIDGVWIGWGEALTSRISANVYLEPATVNLLAHHLSERFPAST